MNRRYFNRLMRDAGLREPQKHILWGVLQREIRFLPVSEDDISILKTAFEISFEGHRDAPHRESGEAYIYHPFRAAIRMIRRQLALHIYDIMAIIEVLLHDCFEDAEVGRRNSMLVRSEVWFLLGEAIATDVHTVTKHKERGESNHAYCDRLAHSTLWRPLWVKFEDRIDNIWTLRSMSHERQRNKIKETQKWFPIFAERLRVLIQNEIQSGDTHLTDQTSNHGRWGRLHAVLRHRLQHAVTVQRFRHFFT